jgi:hypothetical protein
MGEITVAGETKLFSVWTTVLLYAEKIFEIVFCCKVGIDPEVLHSFPHRNSL